MIAFAQMSRVLCCPFLDNRGTVRAICRGRAESNLRLLQRTSCSAGSFLDIDFASFCSALGFISRLVSLANHDKLCRHSDLVCHLAQFANHRTAGHQLRCHIFRMDRRLNRRRNNCIALSFSSLHKKTRRRTGGDSGSYGAHFLARRRVLIRRKAVCHQPHVNHDLNPSLCQEVTGIFQDTGPCHRPSRISSDCRIQCSNRLACAGSNIYTRTRCSRLRYGCSCPSLGFALGFHIIRRTSHVLNGFPLLFGQRTQYASWSADISFIHNCSVN